MAAMAFSRRMARFDPTGEGKPGSTPHTRAVGEIIILPICDAPVSYFPSTMTCPWGLRSPRRSKTSVAVPRSVGKPHNASAHPELTLGSEGADLAAKSRECPVELCDDARLIGCVEYAELLRACVCSLCPLPAFLYLSPTFSFLHGNVVMRRLVIEVRSRAKTPRHGLKYRGVLRAQGPFRQQPSGQRDVVKESIGCVADAVVVVAR